MPHFFQVVLNETKKICIKTLLVLQIPKVYGQERQLGKFA